MADEREQRFARLYAEHRDEVIAYALRRASADVAQDVVAETFAIAWRRLEVVPDTEPVAWLYGTARRVLAASRRRQERQQAIVDRLTPGLQEAISVEPSGESLRAVLSALAQLREDEREAILLAAWEGLDSRQAASVLGCSRTAFRLRLHRARRRLRALLSGAAESQPTRLQVNAATQVKEIL